MHNQPVIPRADLILLTGRRGAGKTRTLMRLVEEAKQAGLTVFGLLSPAEVRQRRKVRLDALAAHSGARRPLASRVAGELRGPRLGDWTFDSETLAWGNALLAQTPPCDLFVLDELGPLEFDLRQGWSAAFDLLAKPLPCRLAVVVVRLECAEAFLRRYPAAETLTIRRPADATRLARQLRERCLRLPQRKAASRRP
ncbi:MAG TPA: nucleoside-triphosphatase [Verrucomicrobiota bacterium]|nr:nucleoside-triphosphatase [Verrucomicrobiota bacterium]